MQLWLTKYPPPPEPQEWKAVLWLYKFLPKGLAIFPTSTYSPHVSHVVTHCSIFLPKAYSVISWKLLFIMLSKTATKLQQNKKTPNLFFWKPEGKPSELFFSFHRFLVLNFPKIIIIAIKTPLHYSIFDVSCHSLPLSYFLSMTCCWLENISKWCKWYFSVLLPWQIMM